MFLTLVILSCGDPLMRRNASSWLEGLLHNVLLSRIYGTLVGDSVTRRYRLNLVESFGYRSKDFQRISGPEVSPNNRC